MKKLTLKKSIKILTVNVLVLLLLLIIIEMILRILGAGYGNNPLEPHQIFHHVHPTDYRFTSYSESGAYEGIEVYYDESRKIAPPYPTPESAPKDSSILFLGDSFVEAIQVPFDSSFVEILNRDFGNTTMLNYGCSAYSPSIYYLQAKEIIANSLPLKMAIIVLYSNDIRDDNNYLQKAIFDENQDLIAINGGEKKWWLPFVRHSYLLRWVRKTQLIWRYKNSNSEENLLTVNNLGEEVQGIHATKTALYVEKTIGLFRENNIPVILTSIPSKYCHFKKDYNLASFPQMVQKWTAEQEITYLDLDKHFQAHTEANNEKLFFERDIHFNEAGHRLSANIFAQFWRDSLNIER